MNKPMLRDKHGWLRASMSGFTLIEIMVVVVIIGILVAIVAPRVMDRPDTARIVKAKQDIRVLESALNLYRLDNYAYPSTEQGLEALVTASPELETGRLRRPPAERSVGQQLPVPEPRRAR
jgi:type II secretion system protein G